MQLEGFEKKKKNKQKTTTTEFQFFVYIHPQISGVFCAN